MFFRKEKVKLGKTSLLFFWYFRSSSFIRYCFVFQFKES